MLWEHLTQNALGAALSTFGEAVLYVPLEGEPFEVRGIFDNDHREVVGDIEPAISARGPMVSFRLTDLPISPDKEGDKLRARGQWYEVADVQPDGQGSVDLMLNETTEVEL